MKNNIYKNLSESDRNFLERMHSQSPRKLTKEDKKVVDERLKKIEEYKLNMRNK